VSLFLRPSLLHGQASWLAWERNLVIHEPKRNIIQGALGCFLLCRDSIIRFSNASRMTLRGSCHVVCCFRMLAEVIAKIGEK
jgi:hypothetical protein